MSGQHKIMYSNRFYSTKLSLSSLDPTSDRKFLALLPSFKRDQAIKTVNDAIAILSSYCNLHLTSLEPRFFPVYNSFLQRIYDILLEDPRTIISSLKSISNWFKVMLTGSNVIQGDISDQNWSRKYSCPVILADMLPILNSHQVGSTQHRLIVILILSALDIHRTFSLPTDTTGNTITDPFSGDMSNLRFDFGACLRSLGIDVSGLREELHSQAMFMKPHVSVAQGPNGSAMWQAHLDAKALAADQTLFTAFKEWCSKLILENILEMITTDALLKSFGQLTTQAPVHSKLHALFERSDKVRVIAIIDYFTQYALSPLHTVIADLLKAIPIDSTFDQIGGYDRVRSITGSEVQALYSLDLSSATDRLPVSIQADLLNFIFGDDIGTTWITLVSKRDFVTPGGSIVRYAVGQPIGCKSSFPMLGLIHHVIVQQAAIEASVTDFKAYAILGDDIVISDARVAVAYMHIMKQLGVGISLTKSIISRPGVSMNRVAEFCRRVAINGYDYSVLPIRLLTNAVRGEGSAVDIQNTLEQRRLILSTENFWLFMAAMLPQEMYRKLVRMNSFPSEISAIQEPRPNTLVAAYSIAKILELTKISLKDITTLWSFILVNDQLQRLDHILKATGSVTDVITTAVLNQQAEAFLYRVELRQLDLEGLKARINELLQTGVYHPVIDAARAEDIRIRLILDKFVSGEREMRDMLLDQVIMSIRSMVLDTMTNPRSVKGAEHNLLFNKLWSHLSQIGAGKVNFPLTYTSKIPIIGKIYNVTFKPGSALIINPPITRVSVLASDTTVKATTYNSVDETF